MLAFCAANAAYLTGLEFAVPGGACLVGGTGGPLAAMLRRRGIPATTLDEHDDMLRALDGGRMSSGIVLGAAPVAQLLEELSCEAVLPFKSGARLWNMAEWQGIRVLATPDKLTRQLENKLALAELAAAADTRIPDTVTVRLDQDLVAAARTDGLALPRVFQPAIGFAGAGTVMLRTANDVADLVEQVSGGASVGKLVEYVAGQPVTVNGVVVPPGVHGADDVDADVFVGMVTRQLTGIDGLTPTEFGSCGNDWSLAIERGAVAAVRAMARRVGDVLAQRGFAGAFGIDAVLPERGGAPVLIEINPRWTASLALQVELQARQGMPTLLDAHLAAFAYRPTERTPRAELLAAYGPDDDAGCTRVVSDVATVIAFNATDHPVRVNPATEPGVWRTTGTAADGTLDIARVRDGWRLQDLAAADEFILVPSGIARPVEPAAYLARVIRRGRAAASPDASSLTDDTRALLDLVVERTALHI